jgi:hypothetical protein
VVHFDILGKTRNEAEPIVAEDSRTDKKNRELLEEIQTRAEEFSKEVSLGAYLREHQVFILQIGRFR